jgi:hypothetical protein
MSSYSDEQQKAFGGVIDVLEALGISYAIWGGVAVIAYGEPRFTRDMDILLGPLYVPVNSFVRLLRKTHYYVDEAAVQNALAGGFFNVIHEFYHFKIDFYVPHEPELQAMIAERVYLPFDEIRQAAYITATSVVAAKLHAYYDSQSTRHLDDIASLIRVQGKDLDRDRITLVAVRLGLLGVWRALWDKNSGAH